MDKTPSFTNNESRELQEDGTRLKKNVEKEGEEEYESGELEEEGKRLKKKVGKRREEEYEPTFNEERKIEINVNMSLLIDKNCGVEYDKFSVKTCKEGDFNIQLKINKLSPVYELEPHSISFKVPVKFSFNKDAFPTNSCLFVQENSETDRQLNFWNCLFPKTVNNESFFELGSFSFALIGSFVNRFFGGKNEQHDEKIYKDKSNNDFKKKDFNLIHPGLNFKINCENANCVGHTDSIIAKSGYGSFQVLNQIDSRLDYISCPICNRELSNMESIKTMILYESKGKIDFKLNKKEEVFKSISFEANSEKAVIFGDEHISNAFSSLKITVIQLPDPLKNIQNNNNLSTEIQMPREDFLKRLVQNNAQFGLPHIVLKWDIPTDLDLHVIDPHGEEISYAHKISKNWSRTGGELDIDKRFEFNSIESIFWKMNSDKQILAPKGRYKVYVKWYSKGPKTNEIVIPFEVGVLESINKPWSYFQSEHRTVKEKKFIYEFDLNY